MTNKDLVQNLISEKTLVTPRIINAFKAIDRKDFVLPGDLDRAYEDRPLSIGYEATISQPTTVAIMLEKLFEKSGDPVKSPYGDNGASKILEIGTGSGYLTALLAKITGERGKVFSVEYLPDLRGLAEFNLRNYNFKNVALFVGDGKVGLKDYAPFNKIVSSASGDKLSKNWKSQLEIGGRIVAPVGSDLVISDKISKRKFKEEKFRGFIFVPLR